MSRDIKLDGGEITVLKAIGLSCAPILGKTLIERAKEMESTEFIDTLDGLLDLGYVLSNKVNIRSLEDMEHAVFRVNSGYAHELRNALSPGRVRDQSAERRRRRG
ncbi:MAG: hypothetical protein ABJB22_01780 [Verrucomicrobiota bacterium]